MSYPSLNELHDCAISASHAAVGHAMANLHRRKEADATFPHDVKLALDRECQEKAEAVIRARFPGHAILGEETPDRARGPGPLWIIDPIDGTSEFAEPPRWDWAIHVALWEKGHLTAGAVAMPTLGRTFNASPAEVVPPSEREQPVLVTSRTRNPYSAVLVANALDCLVGRIGSAGAKAMAVVMGQADIYVHDGGMYQWDSAAPAAVALAAGLHVSRIDGSPVIYNQPDLWLPDLLVCRPELAERALAAIGARR